LNDGSYKFVMYDSYGDGICCGTNGNGEYIVTSNGITLAQGDQLYSYLLLKFARPLPNIKINTV